MPQKLRFNIADERLKYTGQKKEFSLNQDRIIEFNHRHMAVLKSYDLQLDECSIITLADAEKEHIARALVQNDWNITHTAKKLAVSPTTLRKKINTYLIKKG